MISHLFQRKETSLKPSNHYKLIKTDWEIDMYGKPSYVTHLKHNMYFFLILGTVHKH